MSGLIYPRCANSHTVAIYTRRFTIRPTYTLKDTLTHRYTQTCTEYYTFKLPIKDVYLPNKWVHMQTDIPHVSIIHFIHIISPCL